MQKSYERVHALQSGPRAATAAPAGDESAVTAEVASQKMREAIFMLRDNRVLLFSR